LTTSDLLDQYNALGDFTGIKDITGINEDGTQSVNKVINLYEKDKQEFNTIFKLTTKNIKDLNIKTIKLIYGEIYRFLNNPVDLIYNITRKTYTEEYLNNNPVDLIYKLTNKIIERVNAILKANLKYSAKYNIAEYLYLDKYSTGLALKIINKIYDLPEFKEVKKADLSYNVKKMLVYPLIEMPKMNVNKEIDIDMLAYVNWYEGKTIKRGYGTLLPFPYDQIMVEMVDSDLNLEYNISKPYITPLIPNINIIKNFECNLDIKLNTSKFVAVAFGSGNIIYSSNGTIWSQGTISSSADWEGIVYGKGKFVATASNTGKIAYSTDGMNWTEIAPTNLSLESVTYGNGTFVAVVGQNSSGQNSDKAIYSIDGVNWNETPISNATYWENVTYGNGMFVAIGQNSNVIAYSADGITWNSTTISSNISLYGIAYGNGRFVAVGNNVLAYSSNGINWTISTTAIPGSTTWRGIIHRDGKFVAVGNNAAAYSIDGATWTTASITNANWRSVTYGDGKFVAIGSTTYVAYSANGINWNSTSLSINNDWRSITYA
jgi:hypothetical protein